MPRADPVAAHLTYLRQRGRAETTIYERRRLLLRLDGALPVPLLEATPDMLAGWWSRPPSPEPT